MSQDIRVADHYVTCATRERGRKFYPLMLRRMEDAQSWGEIVLDFNDVEFVSPSFLEELFIRLANEHPELASRVLIRGLSEFSAEGLRNVLELRGLGWTLATRSGGEYVLEA